MKIAVIIPFVDRDELLKRCLDSIDERFEAIPWHDEHRAGPSIARNYGIEAAFQWGADYITFLDADDFMSPDAYDQIVAAIKENPKAPIIQLNHRRRGQNGYDYIKFYNKCGTYGLNKLPDFWVGVWNKVYKASHIKDIRFLPGLNHGEDELFNLTCLSVARSIYCSERIHMVHCSDNPQSLSKTVKVEDLIAEQRSLLDFAEYHADDGKLLDAVRQRQAYLWENRAYRSTFSKDDTK